MSNRILASILEHPETRAKRPPSRAEVTLFILLMLCAAGLRTVGLVGAPPGFSDDELAALRITDQVRAGEITVFYNVGDVEGGREGLYYPLLSVFTGLIGDGLFGYRVLGVLLNLGALAFTYGFARRLFGPTVALVALAALAVAFWPVFTARAVAREAALPFVVTGAAYFFLRGFTARPADPADQTPLIWLVTGSVLMGLGLYVHWTAAFFLAGFLLFGVYLNLRYRRVARRQLSNVGFALLVTFIVAVPFSVSLLRTPGVSPLSYFLSHLFEALPESLLNTVAGLFWQGDADPAHNLPGQPVFGPAAGALFVIGVAVAVRRYRRPAYGAVLLALLTALLPDALSMGGPDFRRLVIAMPALYVTAGIGADAALRYVLRRRAGAFRFALVGAAALFALGMALTAHNLNTAWALREDVFVRYHAHLGRLAARLEATAARIPTSICTPSVRSAFPGALSDRDILGYMIHRANLPIRYADCRRSLVLAQGGARQQIAFTYPDGPASLPEPLAFWMQDAQEVNVRGLPSGSVVEIEVQAALGDLMGRFITTAPAGYPPDAPGGPGPATLPVSLTGYLTFEGYQVGGDTYRPGDVVEVTTYWRVDGPTPSALSMFTHVLADPSGSPVAQVDLLGPVVETLEPSDIFAQVHYIPLPDPLVTGNYDLSVGMYKPDGERLAVLDNGAPRGDRLFLQQIHIVAGDAGG